jgi:transcription termination/antitermination protein NusG
METAWYVVHTYSGYENKARKALEDRMRAFGFEDLLEKILIPSESVVEMVKGQKRTSSRKFFPGYILVKMVLNDETWHIVKNTPKITGFVGGSNHPPTVPEAEVERITSQISEGTLRPKPKIEFEKGENVRVTTGPFAGFAGMVDEVKPEKGKLKVLVSIFGRVTPVELEFFQVEKS